MLQRRKPTVSPAAGEVAPGFPGEKIGLSYREAQEYNRIHGLKCEGYTIALAAGVVSAPIKLDIAGNGWILLGFIGHAITKFDDDAAMPVSITISLNKEEIVSNKTWTSIEMKYMTHLYFPFQRYLVGTDIYYLTIDNTGKAEQTVGFDIYYK